MIDMAIISKNQYIQKSLSLLINADPDLRLIMVKEDSKDIFSNLDLLKETVVLIDIEMEKQKKFLDYIQLQIVLYCIVALKNFLTFVH